MRGWITDNLGLFIVLAIIIICIVMRSVAHLLESIKSNRDFASLDIKKRKREIAEQEKKIELLKLSLDQERHDIYNILDSSSQSNPWLAQQIADFAFLSDMNTSKYLETKPHPATVAAQQVRVIAAEKRELLKLCKMYEYQLNYYETLFPWLEEFKELDPKQGLQLLSSFDENIRDEYDLIKNWLSPDEYANLPNAQKYQLVLDRYKKRKKSDWEIGIEFERYIGFLYEKEGFRVKYHGALMGKEDMGRDLIAIKDGKNLVIQCKRWAKEKTIHEKHIFQLYGSTVLLSLSEGEPYVGIFITTATLSKTAKSCADFLKIKYRERFPVNDYPMIKCNIAHSGEKIYHLPFDQQYDRVIIAGKAGAMYAHTTLEAESNGFRRAFKWHPEV